MPISRLSRIALVFLLLPFPSVAASPERERPPSLSAERAPDEPWTHARRRARARSLPGSAVATSRRARRSAEMAARLPDEIDPRDAPDWGSSAAVARGFTALRDQAFFTQDGAAGLLRRLTWLFPDDGCYARAALGGQFLEKSGRPRPRKLFAFGNLRVRTPHHPGGAVYWWYHVVPAVRAGAELYALDPAVEPSRPLPWREWLSRMSDDPASLAISLCDPSTYMPSDPCRGARAAEEAQAPADLRRFLPREWNRVRALGLDPERALRAAG